MNIPQLDQKMSSISTSHSDTNEFLFNPEKLTRISKWKELETKLSEKNMIARPLRLNDYEEGYLELLSQLTTVGPVFRDHFEERFRLMKDINKIREHYMLVVIEDTMSKKIVATSSLVLELKFIHECTTRGRLEEVVVHESNRCCGLGETLVQIMVLLAKEVYDCYKISLDCEDDKLKFYAKNGFIDRSNMLSLRLVSSKAE